MPDLMPRKARPVDEGRCRECGSDRKHEPTCPLVREAAELALSLAVSCGIEALSRPKRKD